MLKGRDAMTIDHNNLAKIGAGLGVIVHYFVMTLLLFFVPIPEGRAGEAVILLIGSSSSMVGLIIGYFYGSSRSSQTKDETINKLAAGRNV